MAPKIVCVASQKGGTGKSTLAIHLSVLAQKAMLIDLDPQQSAQKWAVARKAKRPLVSLAADAKTLPDWLSVAKAAKMEWAILDTAPNARDDMVAAIRCADFVLVPARPSTLDMQAIGRTMDIVDAAKKPAAVVFNACPRSYGFGEPVGVRKYRRALSLLGHRICPIAVTHRVAFSYALEGGRTAAEMWPASKAAYEVQSLWAWLEGEVLRTFAQATGGGAGAVPPGLVSRHTAGTVPLPH